MIDLFERLCYLSGFELAESSGVFGWKKWGRESDMTMNGWEAGPAVGPTVIFLTPPEKLIVL